MTLPCGCNSFCGVPGCDAGEWATSGTKKVTVSGPVGVRAGAVGGRPNNTHLRERRALIPPARLSRNHRLRDLCEAYLRARIHDAT